MKSRLAIVALLALLVAPISEILAGSFQPEYVSADAQWVIHLDFDHGRETSIAQWFRDQRVDSPRVRDFAGTFQERTGIDPDHDLHGLTMYGTSYEPHTGAAVLFADYSTDRVVNLLNNQRDYQTTTYGGETLHSWKETGGRNQAEGYRVTAAFPKSKVIVAGRTVEEVKAALDVLAGKGASLKGKSSPLTADLPKGAMFHGAAIDLGSLQRSQPALTILQQGKRMSVNFGEQQEELFFNSEFVAGTQQVAQQIQQLVEGFRANLALQAKEAPEPVKLIDKLKVARDENTVRIEWRAKSADVLPVLERLQQRRNAPKTSPQ